MNSITSKIKGLHRFFSSRWQTLHLDYPVELTPRFQPARGMGFPSMNQTIERNRIQIEAHVGMLLKYQNDLQNIRPRELETNALLPGWNNGFLPGLDMAALFAFVAEYKPRRYMEVGSGNSTLVAAAAKAQHAPQTEIISIDPYPRAEIDQLVDRVIRRPFEKVDPSLLRELERGDMLFIDNSHRVLPNSDATVFFLEWLTQLAPGVIVQIHDVYLPWDYPADMCKRGYSEQYMLALALLSNPDRYQTMFPAYWVSEQKALAESVASIWQHPNTRDVERHGGSYWLVIGD